jgi:hypothetical protein
MWKFSKNELYHLIQFIIYLINPELVDIYIENKKFLKLKRVCLSKALKKYIVLNN